MKKSRGRKRKRKKAWKEVEGETQGTGLQITVGHGKFADQNLLVSDEIPTVVGHDVQTILLL